VLVFWVIVIALTGSLAGKLMGAEKNDASAYLPASAESTQALKLQDHFTSKNLNPAVVVYVRPSGLTPNDLAKIAADAKQFAALKDAGKVIGPIPSRDHQAAQVLIEAHLGFSSAITNFVNRVHSIGSSGDPGLHVYVTGPAASAADSVKRSPPHASCRRGSPCQHRRRHNPAREPG
jgi:RND superfamily putative drug exporter